MLSFYEEPRTQDDDAIKNELQRRIFLEIQRRLPDLLNRKITHYVSSINREAAYYTDEYLGYQQQQPATTTATAPTTTTTTTPASTTPPLRTILISHSSFRRPQPRPYTELVRTPTPSYTYQHQYTQQVDAILTISSASCQFLESNFFELHFPLWMWWFLAAGTRSCSLF